MKKFILSMIVFLFFVFGGVALAYDNQSDITSSGCITGLNTDTISICAEGFDVYWAVYPFAGEYPDENSRLPVVGNITTVYQLDTSAYPAGNYWVKIYTNLNNWYYFRFTKEGDPSVGCMDKKAINYNNKATKDRDPSACEYAQNGVQNLETKKSSNFNVGGYSVSGGFIVGVVLGLIALILIFNLGSKKN